MVLSLTRWCARSKSQKRTGGPGLPVPETGTVSGCGSLTGMPAGRDRVSLGKVYSGACPCENSSFRVTRWVGAQVALRWFCSRSLLKAEGLTKELIDRIPGKQTDRKTPLGELNWIFTAITDSIAWNMLPRSLFQRLFRQVQPHRSAAFDCSFSWRSGALPSRQDAPEGSPEL